MPYTPILATLGYVVSEDRQQVLLIRRDARPDDHAYGKYNGLGGKIERTEDAAAGMVRELSEEAGITATEMQLRATLSWPGFGKKGEDWLAFVFLITAFEGTVVSSNPEGSLHWVSVEKLLSGELPLWPGDKYFLPLLFDTDPRPIHGVMPYENGEPTSWSFTRL
ncbi:MAG: 8-oxo-dGTP diphosphatase [Armatimonas sp.]